MRRLCLFAVLVLCEASSVDLNLYVSESSTTFRTTWIDAPSADGTKPRVMTHGTSVDRGNRTVHLAGADANGPFVCTARLTRFDLTGPYWVPLRKSGTASFAAVISADDQRCSGEFEGEFTLTVTGACSARYFEKLLLDADLEKIQASLDAHF